MSGSTHFHVQCWDRSRAAAYRAKGAPGLEWIGSVRTGMNEKRAREREETGEMMQDTRYKKYKHEITITNKRDTKKTQ